MPLRMASVCSPSAGAGAGCRISPSVRMGPATSRMRPKWGGSISRIISRARTCSSSRASATLFTGAHGTWPRKRPSHSAVVFSTKRALRRATSSALWARRSAKPVKRGQRHVLEEGLPELVLVAEDDDPAVPRGKVLGRHEGLMPGIGDALRLPLAVERPDREVGEHAHRRVEEGDVDVPPSARPLGVEETDHEPDHARIAAREVDDADSALSGWAVGLARNPHVARVALDQIVEAGLARPRRRRPEA